MTRIEHTTFIADGETLHDPDCAACVLEGEYLILLDTGADDQLRDWVGETLTAAGWNVTVRAARRGEVADATYLRRPGGDWQILGHTIPVPKELAGALGVAWDAAVERGSRSVSQ